MTELDTIDDLLGGRVNTVFDVGANDGYSTKAFLERWPQAQVHAFEPHPEAAEKFATLHADRVNVRLVRASVGAERGEATLNSFSRSDISSLLPFDPAALRWLGDVVEPNGVYRVPVVQLEEYCSAAGIQRIDYLKIDTQGFEARVLTGASGLLNSHRVGVIKAEVLFAPVYEGQSAFHEVVGILETRGYQLFDLVEIGRRHKNALLWADAIFASSELLS